jgi:hypothetical protein
MPRNIFEIVRSIIRLQYSYVYRQSVCATSDSQPAYVSVSLCVVSLCRLSLRFCVEACSARQLVSNLDKRVGTKIFHFNQTYVVETLQVPNDT